MLARGWEFSPNDNLYNLQIVWRFLLESADTAPKANEHIETGQNQEPDPGTSTATKTNTQPGATGLGIYGHESADPGVDPEGQTGLANDNAEDASKFNWNGEESADDSASMDMSSDDSTGNAPGGSGEGQAPADGAGDKKRPTSDEGDGEGSHKKQKTSESGK